MMFQLFRFSCVMILLAETLQAQYGVSAMSVAQMRVGIFPPAESIRVEEFINYHKHWLPEPSQNENLSCSVHQLKLSNRTLLQIGLASRAKIDFANAPQLNLVIVVDCSGSMAGEKLDYVKRGLLAMTERLRPQDSVSLVAFHDDAELKLPACNRRNQASISKAISDLQPLGGTNLHAGLMLGYREAERNFNVSGSNRIILLTDGIANIGVTNPATIAEQSQLYNRKQIDLSTIGVGLDLNRELLRQLADTGRGLAHFIGDCQELEKVFVREVDSLLTPVARDVRVHLGGLNKRDVQVFGYKPEFSEQGIDFCLDNINANATQVILMEIENSIEIENVQVQFCYSNAQTGRMVRINRSADSCMDNVELQKDIRRNYATALVALSIKDSARLNESGQNAKATKKLKRAIEKAHEISPSSLPSSVDLVAERILKSAR